MKKLAKYFLEGVLILFPLVLTIYIVITVFKITDSFLGRYFQAAGINIPGLGLISALAIITLIGLLGSWFVSKRIIDFIDTLFGRMPLVKLIYSIIKDTLAAFIGNRSSFARAVMISLPGSPETKILGFITSEELEWLGLKEYVAVYVLQSMQWAGIILLVPKSQVTLLDVSPEQALQFIISAGITGKS